MDDTNVGGNFYNKYESKNPVARLLMKGFYSAFDAQFRSIAGQVSSILDLGCGEGYFSKRIAESTGLTVRAFDISPEAIKAAKHINPHPKITYAVKNIFDDVAFPLEPATLVVCLEVLEHLNVPEEALKIISALCSQYVLFSVPNEPIWRILNVLRGKYLLQMGNTPGHVNHWTPNQFLRLVEKYFDIVYVERPFPWTMILCKKRLVSF